MTIGIICEYNPFHKGHLYHIQTAQALAAQTCAESPATHHAPIICVMSGHYVQRGEPAFIDKWTRTRMALAGGASLVLELPTYYSSASAEWFSKGSISLLQHTGLVDAISFGMETPEQLPQLETLSRHLAPESPQYQSLLRHHLAQAPSFAAAREAALQELAGQPLDLQSPNTILVLEYLKAMQSYNWHPSLLPVQRASAGYHDLSTEALYPSASAIRREAAKGRSLSPYLPDCCAPYLPDSFMQPDDLFASLAYALCFHTAKSLAGIDEISEGLENRLLTAIQTSSNYNDILNELKTKRYPTARLRRILLNILLNITPARKEELDFQSGPPYIRVLGFRRESQDQLSQLTHSADLPVITNLPRQLDQLPPRAQAMLQDEIRFSQIYASAHPTLRRDCEYRTPMVVL